MLRWWSGAIAYVKKVDAPGGSIAIVDDGVHLILLHRMDGTIQQRPPLGRGKLARQFYFECLLLTKD